MLLSLVNALLLVFTLLWSLMGIIEFGILLKSYKDIKMNISLNQENIIIN